MAPSNLFEGVLRKLLVVPTHLADSCRLRATRWRGPQRIRLTITPPECQLNSRDGGGGGSNNKFRFDFNIASITIRIF